MRPETACPEDSSEDFLLSGTQRLQLIHVSNSQCDDSSSDATVASTVQSKLYSIIIPCRCLDSTRYTFVL